MRNSRNVGLLGAAGLLGGVEEVEEVGDAGRAVNVAAHRKREGRGGPGGDAGRDAPAPAASVAPADPAARQPRMGDIGEVEDTPPPVPARAPAPLVAPLPRNVLDPGFARSPWLLAYPNKDVDFGDAEMAELVADPEGYARRAVFCQPLPLVLALDHKAAQPCPAFGKLVTRSPLLRAIRELGYSKMTPTQSYAFKPVLQGKNMLILGQASVGKTLAALLPAICKVMEDPRSYVEPRIVYLSPTRELAIQTKRLIDRLIQYTKLTSALLIGDQGRKKVVARIRKGMDIAICTPGTFRHRTLGYDEGTSEVFLDLRFCQYFILDEADLLLSDMFTQIQLPEIWRKFPANCATLFVAPFMPSEVVTWLDRNVKDRPYPSYVYSPVSTRVVDSVTNYVVLLADGEDKFARVPEIRRVMGFPPIVTISNGVGEARRLSATLPPEEHVILDYQESQSRRNQVRQDFESGRVPILVGTDLVSTGLILRRSAVYVLVDFRKGRKQFFARRLTRAALSSHRKVVHILHARDMGNFFSFCERWDIKFKYLFPPSADAISQAAAVIERHRRSAEDRSEQWYRRALAAACGDQRPFEDCRAGNGGAAAFAAPGVPGAADAPGAPDDASDGYTDSSGSEDDVEGGADADFEPTDLSDDS